MRLGGGFQGVLARGLVWESGKLILFLLGSNPVIPVFHWLNGIVNGMFTWRSSGNRVTGLAVDPKDMETVDT